MVHKNHNVDQVLKHVQQNNFWGHNNIANVVEKIFSHNGLNVGLQRPNFISHFSEHVRQTELPKGWRHQ